MLKPKILKSGSQKIENNKGEEADTNKRIEKIIKLDNAINKKSINKKYLYVNKAKNV